MSNEDNKEFNTTDSVEQTEDFVSQEDLNTPQFELNDNEDAYVSAQSLSGSNEIQFKEPKRKNKKKLALSLVASLVLICIVAGAVVLASPKMKNSIAMSTKKPADYFTSVVDTNMEKLADYAVDSHKKSQKIMDKKTEGSYDMNLSLTLNPLLTSSFEDMGLNLDNISANIVTNYNESKLQFNSSIALNNVTLLSLLGFADITTNDIYLQIPELSKSYIKATNEMTQPFTGYQVTVNNEELLKAAQELNNMPTDDLKNLILAYGDSLTDNVTDVELTKKVSFTIDKTNVTYNKLSANITEKDFINMLIQYLETVKGNTYMADFVNAILSQNSATLDSNILTIEDCIKELQLAQETASTDEPIELNFFVDEVGIIRGISFVGASEDSTGELVFITAKDKDTFAMDFHVSESTTLVSLIGSSKKSKKGSTGEFVLTVPSDDYLADEAIPTSVSLSFTDINFVGDNAEHMTGNFTLSTSAIPDSSISFDADYKDLVSTVVADVNVSGMSMGSLTITGKEGTFKDFSLPSPSSDTIYNANEEINSYLEEIDIDAFLQNLSDKIGIDLLSLIYGYDSMY